jgi:hypothetical protein
VTSGRGAISTVKRLRPDGRAIPSGPWRSHWFSQPS